MQYRSLIVVTLLAILLPHSPAASAHNMVVAYVPNWIDLKTFAETIDYPRITHINIAFENPTNETGDLSFHPHNDSLIAKAQANHVKILVSIGGGSAATDKTLVPRYLALLTNPKRADFVRKLTDYVMQHNLDGLDVDIEGPAINEDYGVFIADLAKAFEPKGLLLTAALSKGYGGKKVPNSVFQHLDFINIMAYDATGPWDPKSPGQHSSLEFAKDNVKYWLDRGLPREKAVLGVPFYGYGFGDAFRKRDYPYKNILTEHPAAEQSDQVGKTIWYNGIPTIRAKTKYVVDQKLGGIMIWSLDYDVKGERSLLTAIHQTLATTQPPPASQPTPASNNPSP